MTAAGLIPGVPLGIGIGIVSGATFLLLLYTAFRQQLDLKGVLQVAGELLAIPTFWFGGPWLTTKITEIDLNTMLEPYIASLAATFALLLIYPLRDCPGGVNTARCRLRSNQSEARGRYV